MVVMINAYDVGAFVNDDAGDNGNSGASDDDGYVGCIVGGEDDDADGRLCAYCNSYIMFGVFRLVLM